MTEFMKAFTKLAMNCVVKVLKINLSTGEYKIIHLNKGESTSTSPLLEDWVNESCEKELIHPDYIDAFKHIINIDFFNKTFKYKKYIHLKFKRIPMKSLDYRTNVITVIPADETKEEAYLIVYDIEEE